MAFMRSKKTLQEEFACDMQEDSLEKILVKQNVLIFEVLLDVRSLLFNIVNSQEAHKKQDR